MEYSITKVGQHMTDTQQKSAAKAFAEYWKETGEQRWEII
jgi:hypothetical protein